MQFHKYAKSNHSTTITFEPMMKFDYPLTFNMLYACANNYCTFWLGVAIKTGEYKGDSLDNDSVFRAASGYAQVC